MPLGSTELDAGISSLSAGPYPTTRPANSDLLRPLLLALRRRAGVVVWDGVDPGLLALLGRDRGGCLGQWVEAATGLGEGDDVADGVGPGQQGDDAVPAEGDAAVRPVS